MCALLQAPSATRPPYHSPSVYGTQVCVTPGLSLSVSGSGEQASDGCRIVKKKQKQPTNNINKKACDTCEASLSLFTSLGRIPNYKWRHDVSPSPPP